MGFQDLLSALGDEVADPEEGMWQTSRYVLKVLT